MPKLLTANIKRLTSSLLEKVGKVCNSGVPKSETETIKKVWDMTRKVSGKKKKSECVHIKSSNGNMYYSTKEISNALGGNFQNNSSRSNYSQQFQDIKVEKERENLNFRSHNNEKYNLLLVRHTVRSSARLPSFRNSETFFRQ